jgi:LytS/YehU family sensor histidine kinase
MSVADDGQGVPSFEVERVFFAEGPHAHALSLLRRRLQGLFGRSFQLEAWSDVGQGTKVTMRIPLQRRLDIPAGAPKAVKSNFGQLASR